MRETTTLPQSGSHHKGGNGAEFVEGHGHALARLSLLNCQCINEFAAIHESIVFLDWDSSPLATCS
jgi:hypothetical protein